LSISRSQIIGKKVYNPDAAYIGEVYDVGFKVGETTITLFIRTPGGATVEVPWDKVAAVKDIVILKEVVEIPKEVLTPQAPSAPIQPAQQAPAPKGGLGISLPKISLPKLGGSKEQKICPYCGKPATWIEQYQRWYCYNCQRYID